MRKAVWKGSLGFSLVNIPVQLFVAQRKHDLVFVQVHRGTADRIRQQRINERTGEIVEYRDVVKGYLSSDDSLIILEPHELEGLNPPQNHHITILGFLSSMLDPLLVDRGYALEPDRGGAQGYETLLQALQKTSKCAIGRMTMNTKEHIAMIYPLKDQLVLSTLHYHDEIDLAPRPSVDVRQEEVDLACQLIEAVGAPPAYESLHDAHREKILELISAKKAGMQPAPVHEREIPSISSLFDALKQSLEHVK